MKVENFALFTVILLAFSLTSCKTVHQKNSKVLDTSEVSNIVNHETSQNRPARLTTKELGKPGTTYILLKVQCGEDYDQPEVGAEINSLELGFERIIANGDYYFYSDKKIFDLVKADYSLKFNENAIILTNGSSKTFGVGELPASLPDAIYQACYGMAGGVSYMPIISNVKTDITYSFVDSTCKGKLDVTTTSPEVPISVLKLDWYRTSERHIKMSTSTESVSFKSTFESGFDKRATCKSQETPTDGKFFDYVNHDKTDAIK